MFKARAVICKDQQRSPANLEVKMLSAVYAEEPLAHLVGREKLDFFKERYTYLTAVTQFYKVHGILCFTTPESISSPLTIDDDYETTFLLERPIFRAYVRFRQGIYVPYQLSTKCHHKRWFKSGTSSSSKHCLFFQYITSGSFKKKIFAELPSLKLTWHLKITPWKRRFRTWKPSFLGAFAVSFREGSPQIFSFWAF